MATERGGNLNLLDLVEPIREAPLYTSWRNPVPPEWFSVNKHAYTLVDQEALYGSLQFSTNYGRTGAETVPDPTDVATVTNMGRFRQGVDAPVGPTDGAATVRTFLRTASESLAVPTDSSAVFRNSGALINPMIDTYP